MFQERGGHQSDVAEPGTSDRGNDRTVRCGQPLRVRLVPLQAVVGYRRTISGT
jgi:hypothetical protein